MHNGGSDWSAWPCRLAAYDRVYHLDLPVFAKWRHYEAAALHGASRLMHPRFVIVSDRQATVHVETIDGRGRLHCADGPARAWADGTAVWYWHGTRVPRSLIEGDGWTVDQIHAETNTEIRRCAIERIGWGRYADLAGLFLVSEEPDPGHPDPAATLRLYDMPDARRLIGGDVRVLVMANGSPDRSGAVRIYGETVPAAIRSAVEAAAWQYGCPVDVYRQLQRRT
jgi:hypothetical protein